MTKFNEDTRVKIPSILHLCRLGYKYLSLKDAKWDFNINIFTDLQVLQNTKLLNNESYFSTQMMQLVINQFKNKNRIPLNAAASKYINNLVVTEIH